MNAERVELLRENIRAVPDFPKPGILFRDITPLLANPAAFGASLDLFAEAWAEERLDAIVGIESRGFIFGAALAARMGVSFVPARKPGKLPWRTDRVEYELEYGTDALEMHEDALAEGQRVVIVDDLIATGGTAAATIELCRRRGATVVACGFVVELEALEGRAKLGDTPALSLLRY